MTVVFILLWTSEGVIKPESAAGEELVHVGECSTTVANRDCGAGRTSRLSDNSDLAAYCSNIQMLQCESTYRSPPLYCRKYNHILLETLNVMEIW